MFVITELVYYTLAVYTQLLGGLMKGVGLRCDEWRAAHSRNNWLFSLEWFLEFYWDLTYFMLFRYLTVFHVPSASTFALTLSTHLIWEFCAVFGRLHHTYFAVSVYLARQLLPAKLRDECTYNEWRNRLSMDIAVKLGCSLCSGLFFLVNIVVNIPVYIEVGADIDGDFEDDSFQMILIYFGVSVLSELVLYMLVIGVQAKLYGYSMSKPFVGYVKELSNLHIFFILLLYGSVVVPVY